MPQPASSSSQLIGVLVSGEDITERKQAEKDLHDISAELRMIVDSSHECLMVSHCIHVAPPRPRPAWPQPAHTLCTSPSATSGWLRPRPCSSAGVDMAAIRTEAEEAARALWGAEGKHYWC